MARQASIHIHFHFVLVQLLIIYSSLTSCDSLFMEMMFIATFVFDLCDCENGIDISVGNFWICCWDFEDSACSIELLLSHTHSNAWHLFICKSNVCPFLSFSFFFICPQSSIYFSVSFFVFSFCFSFIFYFWLENCLPFLFSICVGCDNNLMGHTRRKSGPGWPFFQIQ